MELKGGGQTCISYKNLKGREGNYEGRSCLNTEMACRTAVGIYLILAYTARLGREGGQEVDRGQCFEEVKEES